jgi:hypothetical protein
MWTEGLRERGIDRRDEANSRSSQFCERAQNLFPSCSEHRVTARTQKKVAMLLGKYRTT